MTLHDSSLPVQGTRSIRGRTTAHVLSGCHIMTAYLKRSYQIITSNRHRKRKKFFRKNSFAQILRDSLIFAKLTKSFARFSAHNNEAEGIAPGTCMRVRMHARTDALLLIPLVLLLLLLL